MFLIVLVVVTWIAVIASSVAIIVSKDNSGGGSTIVTTSSTCQEGPQGTPGLAGTAGAAGAAGPDGAAQKKITLTNPFVAFGDSYTIGTTTGGVSWATILAGSTGFTLQNQAVSSTKTEYMPENSSNSIMFNPTYADSASIIMYGFNDVQSTTTFYAVDNVMQWESNYLAGILGVSLPQDKMDDMKTGWTESGTWNQSIHAYGTGSLVQNDYIEKSITARYYIVRLTIPEASTSIGWTFSLNGVVETYWEGPGTNSSAGSNAISIIIDAKTVAARTFRATITSASANAHYIDWVCGYNSDETNKRDVACLTVPYTSTSAVGNFREERRMMYDGAISNAVQTARYIGLNVVLFEVPNYNSWNLNDMIHWSVNAHSALASLMQSSLFT